MTDIYNPTNEPTNNWKIFSVILLIVLLIGAIYIGFDYIKNTKEKQYQTGYQTGYQAGLQQGTISIIQEISKTMSIPYFSTEAGNVTIKTIPIQQVCNNLK